MPSCSSLRDRFWRDVAIAAGHRSFDPRVIREAIEDMMRNYSLDEVPGFEIDSNGAIVPDIKDFSKHSAFSPVFSRCPSRSSPWNCFNSLRPVFCGPRGVVRRRRKSRSECRHPEHFPGGVNPGIQTNTDQPGLPTPTPNAVSPWNQWQPQLPPWSPNQYIWAFPTGQLAWTPHPQPSPSVPFPMSPWAAVAQTGGYPLPGTMPQWTPGPWPPVDRAVGVRIVLNPFIIPNPANAHLPQIDWKVTKHPSTAKRLTANHVIVDMATIWSQTVTDTEARKVFVTCDVGHMSTLWGPIVVEQTRAVTVRDLFDAVYRYFQVGLTLEEFQYVCELHPGNYDRMRDAYWERCRESTGLTGWEERQGFKRVDALGDHKYWWGVWITFTDGTWHLNLKMTDHAYRRAR